MRSEIVEAAKTAFAIRNPQTAFDLRFDTKPVYTHSMSCFETADEVTGVGRDYQSVEENERQHMLDHVLSILPERERKLLDDYYFKGMLLRETVQGVTRERARQIKNQALQRIRDYLMNVTGNYHEMEDLAYSS